MPQYDPEFELSDMFFDEVSLVPSGDDSMARVALAKAARNDKNGDRRSASSTVVRQQAKRGTPMPRERQQATISKDELPDAVVEYIDAMEDALDDAFDALVASGVIDEDGNVIDGGGDPGDPGDAGAGGATDDERELALAKADPAVRAYIEKADADREQLRKDAAEARDIAKAEQDERVRRDFVSKAATDYAFIGAADDVGSLLCKLHKADPEAAAKVEELFKAANAKIDQADIFQEIGKLGTGSDPSDVQAKATELRKADPSLTEAQARAKVYEDDPALYDATVKGS